MQLSKKHLVNINHAADLVVPDEKIFDLPEKVLQFGTGVLLRGLPDYFIDKANRAGIFNGRIVVVKSTNTGSTDAFAAQDNLYTVCVKGIEGGNKVEEFIINSSISRVLPAAEDWEAVLECAHNPSLQIIISNTTEVGITLVEDDIRFFPPHSFPGKLLAFLYERFKAFNGTAESGIVIIPTELIIDNGKVLKSIVMELAKMNMLEDDFIEWLSNENHFCNSLVDRIVPGALPKNEMVKTEKKLGYKDELMIMAESFRLWAIESSNEKVKEILSFAKADEGVVIAADIEMFRELKLRLLNGTHSFSCGLAALAGFSTVKEAMDDTYMYSFVHALALQEIADAIADEEISNREISNFGTKVIDRFRNPFLDHKWLSISVQYSTKMKMRNLPLILKYFRKYGFVPEHMTLGFAAFLVFMKCRLSSENKFLGEVNGKEYEIIDNAAPWFYEKWKENNIDRAVDSILGDKEFWGTDLIALNGFPGAVKLNVHSLVNDGAMNVLQELPLSKTNV